VSGATGAPSALATGTHSSPAKPAPPSGQPKPPTPPKPVDAAHSIVFSVHVAAGASTSDTAPQFVNVSLICVPTGETVDIAGYPNPIPLYAPQLSWEAKNATGMALSIDNPGLVGAYETYTDWHGSTMLGSGCYTDNGSHRLDLYTVGGAGTAAHVVIMEHGTLSEPVEPPFAQPSATH
jgi:hypothetical protein